MFYNSSEVLQRILRGIGVMDQVLVHGDKATESKQQASKYNAELKRRIEELQKFKGEA